MPTQSPNNCHCSPAVPWSNQVYQTAIDPGGFARSSPWVAALPERVYVIEIKAAYPRRPNWQRIFDNNVFLHFAGVSRGPPGGVRSVRCLGWLVVGKRGGSDLGRATRTGPVQGNLRGRECWPYCQTGLALRERRVQV